MSGTPQRKPQGIGTFHDFVPQPVRFVLFILFACAFQFTGGVYLASVEQMVGARGLLEEDIRMIAYTSFIGLTVTFPLVFRVKFRFKQRDILMGAAIGIALCNVITMYSGNIVLLMVAGFITGALRLIGTFESMSSIQSKLAPNHDQRTFYCVLFAIILTAIQLSGVLTAWLDYRYDWQQMHLFIVALMIGVALCAFFLMKDRRFMKRLPLYGIDWTGAGLWTTCLLAGCLTLQYGKHLDWYYSPYIRGMGYALLYISLTVYSTGHIPFKYFLQPIGLLGFVRTGIVTVASAALLSNWMTWLVKKNLMLLGWQLDVTNPGAASLPLGTLTGEVTRQALLVSMKELLGWFTMGGIAVLILILAIKYVQPITQLLPRLRTFYTYLTGSYKKIP